MHLGIDGRLDVLRADRHRPSSAVRARQMVLDVHDVVLHLEQRAVDQLPLRLLGRPMRLYGKMARAFFGRLEIAPHIEPVDEFSPLDDDHAFDDVA